MTNWELKRKLELAKIDDELDKYFPMPDSAEPNPYMGDYMSMPDYKRWRDMHEPDYFDYEHNYSGVTYIIGRQVFIVFTGLMIIEWALSV